MTAFRGRLVSVDAPDEWRAALAGIAHGYWHGWEACCSASLASGMPTFLYVCEDDTGVVRAVCPFSERRWQSATDIFTPTGFSGFAVAANTGTTDCELLRACWREFAATRGYVCAYFALHPLLACCAMHENLHDTNDLFVIDLSAGADAVFAAAEWEIRRAQRDWQRDGREYVLDRDVLTGFIVEHYVPFMKAQHANPAALWSVEGLQVMCRDPALLMVGVADDQGICAAYAFGTTPFGAESHINISVREGRRHTRALTNRAISELAARGIPWLNLGGGVRRGDALAMAKRKFRPQEFPLLSAKEIYWQDEYAALCDAAGFDSSDAEGFFPKYRQRRPA